MFRGRPTSKYLRGFGLLTEYLRIAPARYCQHLSESYQCKLDGPLCCRCVADCGQAGFLRHENNTRVQSRTWAFEASLVRDLAYVPSLSPGRQTQPQGRPFDAVNLTRWSFCFRRQKRLDGWAVLCHGIDNILGAGDASYVKNASLLDWSAAECCAC
jgi:hypothetical protein